MTRALGPVRCWVWLYTSGLPSAVRDARRAELESDLWEEWRDRTARGSSGVGTIASIWIRWLSGIPGDLAWRIELGAQPSEAGGSPSRLLGLAAGMTVAMLLLLVIVAVNTSQYQTGAQPVGATAAALLLLAVGMAILGIVAAVHGHRVMGGRPAEGAVLVVGGSLIAGLAWYWLLLPVLVALVVVAHGLWRAVGIVGSTRKA